MKSRNPHTPATPVFMNSENAIGVNGGEMTFKKKSVSAKQTPFLNFTMAKDRFFSYLNKENNNISLNSSQSTNSIQNIHRDNLNEENVELNQININNFIKKKQPPSHNNFPINSVSQKEEENSFDSSNDNSQYSSTNSSPQFISDSKENQRMIIEMLKAFSNSSTHKGSIETIKKEYNIDLKIDIISIQSEEESEDNEKEKQPVFHTDYCFDLDEIIFSDIFIERLCFLTIPRIVYIQNEIFLLLLSPSRNKGKAQISEKYMLVFKSCSSTLSNYISINCIISCFSIGERSFCIQFFSNRTKLLNSYNISTNSEKECINYVKGINFLRRRQRVSI